MGVYWMSAGYPSLLVFGGRQGEAGGMEAGLQLVPASWCPRQLTPDEYAASVCV